MSETPAPAPSLAPSARWVGFSYQGAAGFGTLADEQITEHSGDLFGAHAPTGRVLPLSEVTLGLPCRPSKLIAVFNNDSVTAAKQGVTRPAEPRWALKAPSSYRAHGQTIERPAGHDGRILYEGELGLVIGKVCKGLTPAQAAEAIFGVTCINDVTALDLMVEDPAFPQHARAKSFDTFGVFGPVIATGLDPLALRVRTLVNGRERQSYPVTQLLFTPAELVSALSRDLTLLPGDLVACGTAGGVLPMKPGMVIEVVIDGVGTLRNTFEAPAQQV